MLSDSNNKCKLLDIDIPLGMICPASKDYEERFVCYKDCGFSPLRDPNKNIKIKIKNQIQTKICQ